MSDLIGKRLANKYDIQAEIGRGGMGIVYRGFDIMLERTVAIKVLPVEMTFDQKFVARFRQEAVMAASLHHPSIVVTHDVGQEDRIHYIVMQFLPGRTLDQWLAQHGPMPLTHMVHVLQQIGDALDYAHRRKIIHRDIKPSNIMLDDDGHATLMDFGLVRAGEGAGLTRQDMVVGTPDYIAPEQASGKPLDHRADIYSLGVVVYRSLAGQAPFVRSTPLATVHAHVYEAPPPLRQFRPDLSRPVEAVVSRALAKDPAHRFQEAGQFARELATASAGKNSSASPALGLPKLPKFSISPPPGATVAKGSKSSPQGGMPAPPPSSPHSAAPPPTQIMGSLGGSPAGAPTQVMDVASARKDRSESVTAATIHSAATSRSVPAAPRSERQVPRFYLFAAGFALLLMLAAGFMLRPGPRDPGTPTVTGGPVALPAKTETATPVMTDETATPSPTKTPTPTLTHTPTNTPANTPTPTPTNTPANTPTPTDTPIPTNTPMPTPTNTSKPTPTPTPTKTKTTVARLIAPAPGSQVRSDQAVEFVWSYNGALAPNQGFEVRVWKDGQPHYGAAAPVLMARASINLGGAYGVQTGGSGRYWWTVAVVQRDPYQSLGPEAAAQEIEIEVVGTDGVPTPRAEPYSCHKANGAVRQNDALSPCWVAGMTTVKHRCSCVATIGDRTCMLRAEPWSSWVWRCWWEWS